MTLTHARLGDVKHQAEVSQGRHFLGVFFFGERVEYQRQSQGVGLHRAARAVQQKVMEESCSDVCVCKKKSSEGNTRLISVV